LGLKQYLFDLIFATDNKKTQSDSKDIDIQASANQCLTQTVIKSKLTRIQNFAATN